MRLRWIRGPRPWLLAAGLVFWYWNAPSDAQTSNSVTIHATVQRTAETKHEKSAKRTADESNIVAWLKPLDRTASASETNSADRQRLQLVQHNKNFQPHVLAVPVGSVVDFPNRDPFFHNVFSLFDGKRFDLGLYESGTSRSVRFDREGVSYIFCNIHPEMGAIVLALNTPYYGVSGENGVVALHNVPPGSYRLNVWSENGQPADSELSQRIVQVSTEPLHLGEITLQKTTDALAHHKNIFGEDYEPAREQKY